MDQFWDIELWPPIMATMLEMKGEKRQPIWDGRRQHAKNYRRRIQQQQRS